MKIDRKFFEKFEEQVKAEPEVREHYARGDVRGAEEAVIAKLFNKPEDFFNLEKPRKAVQVDRRITLREILPGQGLRRDRPFQDPRRVAGGGDRQVRLHQ